MAFISLSNTDGEREHGLSESFNKLLQGLQPAGRWASGSWQITKLEEPRRAQ